MAGIERMETRLIRELVRAKLINATREFEAARTEYVKSPDDLTSAKAAAVREHWDGQRIMAQSILTILEGDT